MHARGLLNISVGWSITLADIEYYGARMQDRSVQVSERARGNYVASYGHLEMFHDVEMDAISQLLDAVQEIDISAGHTVLEEGTFHDAAYTILDGELEVRLGTVNAKPLLTLGVGACVGELSILSQLNVSAYVVAVRESRLLVIRDDLPWSLIDASHEFAGNLLKVLSGRVRDNNNRLTLSINA